MTFKPDGTQLLAGAGNRVLVSGTKKEKKRNKNKTKKNDSIGDKHLRVMFHVAEPSAFVPFVPPQAEVLCTQPKKNLYSNCISENPSF